MVAQATRERVVGDLFFVFFSFEFEKNGEKWTDCVEKCSRKQAVVLDRF